MQILNEETKFAHLGKPGSLFSKGFQRRMDIITRLVSLKDKKILDLGCGEGVWMHEFRGFTNPENIYGEDIDPESVKKFEEFNAKFAEDERIPTANLVICPAEKLEFPDDTFDIVFQNEVLEHVNNDQKTLDECYRVLKPGGKLIIFTPNRGWPFEQHGMFFRGKYYWGNIPLLPWLPRSIFNKFAPHVRNYWWGELRAKFLKSGFNINHHTRIFPGFDGMVRRFGIVGRVLQRFIHILEKTPLRFFGISHLVIAEK